MSYTIAGQTIKNEYIALGTFAIAFGGAALAMSGGSKKAEKKPEPAITASSKEEEAFIRDFVARLEREEATNKAKH